MKFGMNTKEKVQHRINSPQDQFTMKANVKPITRNALLRLRWQTPQNHCRMKARLTTPSKDS